MVQTVTTNKQTNKERTLANKRMTVYMRTKASETKKKGEKAVGGGGGCQNYSRKWANCLERSLVKDM